jgi:hypothetical protein
LAARGEKNGKTVELTMCTKASKDQEGWLNDLVEAGVALIKEDEDPVDADSLHELVANDLITGKPVTLSEYKDKVLLVVNVASC